jgi:hypothetical protein
MASVNWDQVTQQAIAAAASSLAGSWNRAAPAASHSIQLLVNTAESIANNSGNLPADEQKVLIDDQKLAMQNVLLGYEDIAIAAREQAVAAVWGVVQTALITAMGRLP